MKTCLFWRSSILSAKSQGLKIIRHAKKGRRAWGDLDPNRDHPRREYTYLAEALPPRGEANPSLLFKPQPVEQRHRD